jgi:hypothetical protein
MVMQWISIEKIPEKYKTWDVKLGYPPVLALMRIGSLDIAHVVRWDDEKYYNKPKPHWRTHSLPVTTCRAAEVTHYCEIPEFPA